MGNQHGLPDFVRASNQGLDPELYEIENQGLDRGNLVWDALGALAPWAAKSIVDLGCGTGFWLPRYAKSAHTVIGVETGTSLLAAARARTGAAVVLSSTPGSRISFRPLPTTAPPDWPRPCGCFGPAGHSS